MQDASVIRQRTKPESFVTIAGWIAKKTRIVCNNRTEKGDETADRRLIPQPHGGALLAGGQRGQTPGPGRPRSAIRATMREQLDALLPRVLAEVEDGTVTALAAAEMCARYGVGTQTETVTVEEVRQQAARIVEEVVRIAREWGRSDDEIHAVLARLSEAARTPTEEESR